MQPRSAARILIVDAERNARNALRELLHDEGYEVSTAVDEAAAGERIADFHPDLVLSDVQLDGAAVVLMSAQPRPCASGAPFIGKPIDIEELLATVQTTLARRG
jgi:DNA-binding response OmpR family regulator